MEVFIEPIEPSPAVYIFGAGTSASSSRASRTTPVSACTWSTIAKSSPTASAFPTRPRSSSTIFPSWLTRTALPSSAYAVVVTRGHRHDLDALRALARANLRYLGLIGSRAKVKRIYDVLVEDGSVDIDHLESVHAPIGLDIGAVTPQEIAVSIVAELIAVRRGQEREIAAASLEWMPKLKAAQNT